MNQTRPKLCIIVAIDENFAIGKNGGMLTHLPADLKYFKETTKGHTVLMGRKTFDSLPNGALPDRRNIIISRQKNIELENCIIINSFSEFHEIIKNEDVVFVLGGGEIFSRYINEADLLYLTRIHHKFEGSQVFFPEIDFSKWELIESKFNEKDAKNPQDYTFEKYKRKNGIKVGF